MTRPRMPRATAPVAMWCVLKTRFVLVREVDGNVVRVPDRLVNAFAMAHFGVTEEGIRVEVRRVNA